LVLISAGIFLVMLFTLNSIVFKPLLKFMEDRDNSITSDLNNANKNSSSIEELKEEATKIILAAKIEANKIREASLDEAKVLLDQKLKQRQEEISKEYSEFKKSVELVGDELKTSLMANKSAFDAMLKNKIESL
jgi:F-type H+-transporting ATPase subunit b